MARSKTLTRNERSPRGERRALILRAARRAFSELGFSVSTREIAAAMGVAQPLLYKYFPSKESLIKAAFEERLTAGDFFPSADIFDRDKPFVENLIEFYREFIGDEENGEWMRLYMRGALDRIPVAALYRSSLNEKVLQPVIAAARRDVGAPSLSKRRMTPTEREAALALHAGVVFLRIRTSIYAAPPEIGFEKALRLSIRMSAPGLAQIVAALHGRPAPSAS